jgi:hypothetical protein
VSEAIARIGMLKSTTKAKTAESKKRMIPNINPHHSQEI